MSGWRDAGAVAREHAVVAAALDADERNNSAWHHAYQVLTRGAGADAGAPGPSEVELEGAAAAALARVARVAANEAAWNFLRALVLGGPGLAPRTPGDALWSRVEDGVEAVAAARGWALDPAPDAADAPLVTAAEAEAAGAAADAEELEAGSEGAWSSLRAPLLAFVSDLAAAAVPVPATAAAHAAASAGARPAVRRRRALFLWRELALRADRMRAAYWADVAAGWWARWATADA
jgi:hypothetical protein